MQPTFPSDHHFYRRRGGPAPPATRRGERHSPDEFAALTDRALTYFTRQCLPVFDPSDPRGPGA